MSLTPKQEKFAQCVADGMTQADSYRTAYDVDPECKPETIWSRASELMSDRKVSGRVAELKAALSAKALWTREDSVRVLKEAIDMARDMPNAAAITGAIKELNAMHGFNAPQKIMNVDDAGKAIIPTQIVICAPDKK
jgi:hypothetical protein